MRVICENKHIDAEENFCDIVAQESGQDIDACYQCGKCTASCPLARAMDWMPNQIIHAVQLGLKDLVLDSNAIWHCAACETCASRCPRDIDMSRVNKALARICIREGRTPKDPAVAAFHKSFIESMARWGRAHELEVISLTKLRNARQRFRDIPLGAWLFAKGRLSLLPHYVRRGAKRVREILAQDKEKSLEARQTEAASAAPAEMH